MRVFANISKVMSFAGAVALMTIPGCSCGDDDGANPDARVVIDAQTFDADTTDATEHDADIEDLLSGTLAVTQVTVTNDMRGLGIPAVNGGVLAMSFLDETTRAVAPAFGNGDIGTCTVFVYEVGDTKPKPPTEIDEGVITVTGTGLTPNSAPPCAFAGTGMDYLCTAGPVDITTGSVITHTVETIPTGSVFVSQITVTGKDFEALGAVGSMIKLEGFTAELNFGGTILTNNGLHMVHSISVFGGGNKAQLVIINTTLNGARGLGLTDAAIVASDLNGETYDGTGTAPTYTLVTGSTPIFSTYEYITDYTKDITIAKTKGTLVDAFSITLKPSGGSAIDDDLVYTAGTVGDNDYDLDDLNLKATGNEERIFSCEKGVDCGLEGADGSAGQIYGWTLTGTATDGSLTTGCDGRPCSLPIQMPDPEVKWADFTCIGAPNGSSVKFSAGALDAIMAIGPTRIQSRLLRITADTVSHAPLNIVVGGGFVGFSDPIRSAP